MNDWLGRSILGAGCSFSKAHVLVGGKESHEHWHLDDLNESGSVDIEVGPGSWEIGVEIFLEGITSESFMGVKYFSSGGSGSGFVHPEVSSWLSFIWCILGTLGLESVLLDH